jgi:hypothetical protein
MSWEVQFQAQQTVLSPDGREVVIEVGDLRPPGHQDLVDYPRVFRPVPVEVEDAPAKAAAKAATKGAAGD